MSWCPDSDRSDDLRTSWDMYEESDNNYGLNKLKIRPGKTPLDAAEYDDEVEDMPPDAMAELRLEAYRRKLGFPKKTEKSRWPDDATVDDSSVDLEICKIIRNTGSDREPRKNPLNSKTTSKTAIPLDKFPVAGVKDLYLTPDHFKFGNVYFHSKSEPKKEEVHVQLVKENDDYDRTNTAERKTFREPRRGVSGEQYVSPRQSYLMKARHNR
ncbi:uncharacterized protein LOC119081373 [Bradysia coprophila]|uniref:uncharacterized protein LOC119081373 n=1 Tax=Bradysia coprophila TaxID=38358 RepID=UPI00187D9ED5|nr:uncharacterized protein LOC119081373 [Bradysia coprophila]